MIVNTLVNSVGSLGDIHNTGEVMKGQSTLDELLVRHEKIFAVNKFDIGTVRNYKASIKLVENKFEAQMLLAGQGGNRFSG